MKKFVLSAVLSVFAAVSLSAQTDTTTTSWFVNVAGGASIYAGEHTRQLKITNITSYSADIAVGKWFNPFIAARVVFSDFNEKGATFESYFKQDSNGAPIRVGVGGLKKNYSPGAQHLFSQQFNAMNLHADFMVNVSNLFGSSEKTDKHFWNAIPYVGLGFPYIFTPGKSGGIPLSVNGGLYNCFPVSDKIDITADFRAVLLDERFDGETGGMSLEGYAGVNIGISYKF